MLSLMTSVYTALHAGVSCAVSRAWPNRDPILPSLSFRLLSWKKQPDGSALAVFAVQIRAVNPAYCDELAEDADTAMASIGFSLSGASDDVEPDTGFPLKLLEYSAVLGGAAVEPLVLSFDVSGTLYPVGGITDLRVEPGERPLFPASVASANAEAFILGRPRLQRIFVSGIYLPSDQGQLYLASYFNASYLNLYAIMRLARGSVFTSFRAYVFQYCGLPSGFSAALQCIL